MHNQTFLNLKILCKLNEHVVILLQLQNEDDKLQFRGLEPFKRIYVCFNEPAADSSIQTSEETMK